MSKTGQNHGAIALAFILHWVLEEPLGFAVIPDKLESYPKP